ncbi:MAG: SRPBCC domain-containing protein [candidate division Zixibacteria bacterium]|nr:SRPBCC domain-containing protein [candidate division Zixibacteria bacterium]
MAKPPAYDWSAFEVGIYIMAKPDEVFDLLGTAKGLTRWFLRTAGFAASEGRPADRKLIEQLPPFDSLSQRPENERCRTNDRYQWEWHYGGGVIGEEWILDCRPPTRLVFGFGDQMEVAVRLRKLGRFCEVNLRQYNIPDNASGRHNLHMGCRVAWAFFLANLKSVAEGGLDLRETDRARTRQLHLVNI